MEGLRLDFDAVWLGMDPCWHGGSRRWRCGDLAGSMEDGGVVKVGPQDR